VHRGVTGSAVGKRGDRCAEYRLCGQVSVIQEGINMVGVSIIGVLFRGMSARTKLRRRIKRDKTFHSQGKQQG
jgi:hypothetical protein